MITEYLPIVHKQFLLLRQLKCHDTTPTFPRQIYNFHAVI